MGDALLGRKDVQYPNVEHGLNLPNRASQQWDGIIYVKKPRNYKWRKFKHPLNNWWSIFLTM